MKKKTHKYPILVSKKNQFMVELLLKKCHGSVFDLIGLNRNTILITTFTKMGDRTAFLRKMRRLNEKKNRAAPKRI